MRLALPLLAILVAGTAASAQQAPPTPRRDAPIMEPLAEQLSPRDQFCRDRIHEVRTERGLPRLDRGNADAEDGVLIAAVDQRIGECSVMVMYNNTSDIRPVPTAPAGKPRLQRIPGQ